MVKKVYWDKGHGGSDPGAVGNGLQEKDLNHKIVEYAMAHMAANYTGVEQRESRSGDQSVSLLARSNAANAWGADVFVSSHINAGGGTGFETFIHPQVPRDTIDLQSTVHAEVLAAMRKFDSGLRDRGKKRADFSVLRNTDMSALLTEILFIDTSDYKHLKNNAFLKAVGEAYSVGVAKHLKLAKKAQPKPEPAKTSSNEMYSVQIFAGSKAGADRVVEQARKAGFKDAYAWKK